MGRANLRLTLPRDPDDHTPPRISVVLVDLTNRTFSSRMTTTGWGPFTMRVASPGSYGVLVKRGHHPRPDPGDLWDPRLVPVDLPEGRVPHLQVTPVDA